MAAWRYLKRSFGRRKGLSCCFTILLQFLKAITFRMKTEGLTTGRTASALSKALMKQTKWFIHPVIIFILSTVALAISLFLYIYWYVRVSAGLKSVIGRYQLDANQFFEAQTWVVILILSLLVGVILAGILIIFIYNLKTLQLYRLQHTFINNFTHELKTPVTSLKLYLETFAKHDLPREEQLKYIGFMLQDVERLSGNINSILNLARIESRVYEGKATPVDLMETIRQFIADNRHLFRNCDIRVENPPNETLYLPRHRSPLRDAPDEHPDERHEIQRLGEAPDRHYFRNGANMIF